MKGHKPCVFVSDVVQVFSYLKGGRKEGRKEGKKGGEREGREEKRKELKERTEGKI